MASIRDHHGVLDDISVIDVAALKCQSIPSARFLGASRFEAMTVVADVTQKATVSALSVENVSHAYGARIALDKVSFDVAPASFTVLLA